MGGNQEPNPLGWLAMVCKIMWQLPLALHPATAERQRYAEFDIPVVVGYRDTTMHLTTGASKAGG